MTFEGAFEQPLSSPIGDHLVDVPSAAQKCTLMSMSGRDVRQDRGYHPAPEDLVNPESHYSTVHSAPDPQLLGRSHSAS